VWVIAHRGSSRSAPENTLSAIRCAIEDGADYAEVDVQETADGEVVLLHDPDLQRTTGRRGKIWRTTYAELTRLDAGSWFAPAFAGERIPTLAEVIDVVRGKIGLVIEIKVTGREKNLVQSVVQIVRKAGFDDECFITSMSASAIKEVKRLAPALQLGLVVRSRRVDLTGLTTEHVALRDTLATSARICAARARGQRVHVWTVNDPGAMSRLVALGVDGILTDRPARLRKAITERG